MDRVWAYWEAIHRDQATFNDSYAGFSRYSTPGGTTISPDSPLEPFFRDGKSFHTTRSVASIRGFGYTYQGLEYWQKSDDQMRLEATRLVNRLYSPGGATQIRLMSMPAPSMRGFVRVQLDRAEVERPCSVNVFVGGRQVGSLIIMKQPGAGIMQGALAINDDEHATAKGSNQSFVQINIQRVRVCE